ncbi:MAG: DUF58 domain-containing protein [Marmoricola sp.]
MRSLTLRGRCFLAAGAAAVVCGVQIGERDFVRIGLLAALLPLLAWLWIHRGRRREVWVRRNVSAVQIEAGGSAQVEVEVTNSGTRTGVLLLEEELSPALGERQRFVLEPLTANAQTTLRYPIHAHTRGRYPVGPMHVRVGDPIGMVELDQVIPSESTILVTPHTEPLPRIALTGRWAGAGDDRTRELLGGGSPDVTIREYRLGDDLRRIHWPTSARVDELMVRREEQQWQSRCTVLLDNRRITHRGYGQHSSMERAVSVTASVLRALVAMDFEVRLIDASGRSTHPGWQQGARGASLAEHLERLAVIGATRNEQLSTGWVDETQHGGMLLAVLGHLGDADRDRLGGFATAGDSAYAVVLDVATWDRTGRAEEPATAALRSGGWKASTLTHDGSLAAAWQELAR